MAKNNTSDPKQLRAELQDTLTYIDDTIISIFSNLNTKIGKQIKESGDQYDRDLFRKLKSSAGGAATALGNALKRTSAQVAKVTAGTGKLNELKSAGANLDRKIAELEQKRDILARNGLTLGKQGVKNLKEAYAQATKVSESTVDLQKSIQKEGDLGLKIFQSLADTPFLGTLLNAEVATEEIQKNVLKGKGAIESFAIGAKKAFMALEKGTVILAAIAAIKKVFDFIVSSMFRADELTTSMAKGLGISKKNAEEFEKSLKNATRYLEGTAYISEEIYQATAELAQTQGAITQFTKENADQQAFLTKFIGLSAEQAANLNTVYINQGTNAEKVYNQIALAADEAETLTGNTISTADILKTIGELSADIQANFGFSTKELTDAVLQTRRFGVSLQQANNIAGGLLDFEQSIGAELEAEILLGKQFNFERARALAATGDIAGATEEVLKQTQNLSAEQLRSPLAQGILAKATGLNADELIRSIQLTKMLNKSQGKYDDLLENAANQAERRKIQEGILNEESAEQIKKNITAQEQFNNAISNAKDQFAALVGSGVIDMLTGALPSILQGLAKAFGSKEASKRADLQQSVREKLIEENKTRGEDEQIDVQAAVKESTKVFDEYWKARTKYIEDEEFVVFQGAGAARKFGSADDNNEKILKLILDESKKTNSELGTSSVLNISANGVMQKFIETNYN